MKLRLLNVKKYVYLLDQKISYKTNIMTAATIAIETKSI
jgi:hypothetical protein